MAVVDVLTGWFLQLPFCVCLLDAWPDDFSSKRFACEGGVFPQTGLLVSSFFSLQRSWLDGCARCLSPCWTWCPGWILLCLEARESDFRDFERCESPRVPCETPRQRQEVWENRWWMGQSQTCEELWQKLVVVVWLLCDGLDHEEMCMASLMYLLCQYM